jgi:enamine deaminase RidA (YjgF/YER057c/UK114 family)
MAVNLVRSARLFAGTGYAYAAIASAGDLIFTAGACPLDDQGIVVAPGDLIAQTRQALANLKTALEDSGAAIEDVVKTTVYVASSDRGELAAAFDEVAALFGDHDVPSTLLGVALLGYRDQLVEIEAIAVQPTPARRAAASHPATSPAGE